MPKGYKDLLLKEVKELLKKLPPNVRIRVYYDDMGKSKYTLNQIGDALFEFIEATNKNFKRVNERLDNVEKRLDNVEARLDYNGLKKLPEVH